MQVLTSGFFALRVALGCLGFRVWGFGFRVQGVSVLLRAFRVDQGLQGCRAVRLRVAHVFLVIRVLLS